MSKRLVLIGGGNMGGSLLRGVLRAGFLPADNATVVEVDPQRADALGKELGVRVVAQAADVVPAADLVLLAVKPFALEGVLGGLQPLVSPAQLVVSVVAGAHGATIRDRLGKNNPVVRVMPNLGATVDAAASAIAACPPADEGHLGLVEEMFLTVGEVVRVDERQIDAVTGLSGSGPAYVFLVIEALADGGVQMGLSRAVALKLATQTVFGAAKLVKETALDPAVLKGQVTTPAGTTIAGLHVLEGGAVRGAFMDAVKAATERARELSRRQQ